MFIQISRYAPVRGGLLQASALARFGFEPRDHSSFSGQQLALCPWRRHLLDETLCPPGEVVTSVGSQQFADRAAGGARRTPYRSSTVFPSIEMRSARISAISVLCT